MNKHTRSSPRLRRTLTDPAPWTHYTPIITWTLAIAYAALAIGMIGQPGRFGNTPSYANLLQFAGAPVWGATYAGVATALAVWRLAASRDVRRHRGLGVIVHTAAIALTLWWLVAFIVRYATDDGTTIVNVVSWTVFLSLVVRSSLGLDEDPTR